MIDIEQITPEEYEKNLAYTQRNMLAIAFARMALALGWKAGRGYDGDLKKNWLPEWRHLVYVQFPSGTQVSWHMSPDCVPFLDNLPLYDGNWDETFLSREQDWFNKALQGDHESESNN